jgi:excisionase family DNA binding protein
MTVPVRQFLSVKEVAELLGISVSTVQEAVRTGKLKALTVGESIATARIHITSLIPPDVSANDLRTRRLRRLTLEARDRRDAADRKKAEWLEAERVADEALRAIEHALAIDEIEISRDRVDRVLIAN